MVSVYTSAWDCTHGGTNYNNNVGYTLKEDTLCIFSLPLLNNLGYSLFWKFMVFVAIATMPHSIGHCVDRMCLRMEFKFSA